MVPSGAMYSVISFLACVAPKATFQLYGIIPVPAWLCVSGLFLYDVYSAMNDKVCHIIHESDLCFTYTIVVL